MPWAILDTNIYIGHWEHGRHQEALERVRKTFIIRHSSVVLSELRRGAKTPEGRRLVEDLHRMARVQWEPSAEDWWEAGRVLRKVGDAQRWDRSKLRDFQNDALIALTARRHGAGVVTENRSDFELLAEEIPVTILFT